MIENILLDTLVTGLPLLPVFLGIYLVLRIREDFDLTVEGSFVLGGSACAVVITHGGHPLLGMVVGVLAGVAAGLVTSVLAIGLRLPVLLGGLVMSMALFSINLRVLARPTVSLASHDTIFRWAVAEPGRAADLATSGILAGIVLVVFAAFALFLKTELGLALRASGVNARMVRSQGVDDRAMLVLSLAISNGLAALGGCLTTQMQGYADVNMGAGAFVSGVGAVLLGVLFVNPTGSQVIRIVVAVLLGGLVYRLILVAALRFGMPSGDLKAVTALTLIIAVAAQSYLVPTLRRYGVRWRERGPGRNTTDEPWPDLGEAGDHALPATGGALGAGRG